MPLDKPYPNIYRHGPSHAMEYYAEQWKSPEAIKCFASYELLKEDLREILDFIEPDAANLATYSHRTFQLLLRACAEVETLCRQVFSKNCVALGNHHNIIRYSDLDGAMKLSHYEVISNEFNHPTIRPFAQFASAHRADRSPQWYRAYNAAKHDRSGSFHEAKLEHVISAVSAVYTLLVAQYGLGFDHVLTLSPTGRIKDRPDMFRAKELPTWDEPESYGFHWEQLRDELDNEMYHLLPTLP